MKLATALTKAIARHEERSPNGGKPFAFILPRAVLAELLYEVGPILRHDNTLPPTMKWGGVLLEESDIFGKTADAVRMRDERGIVVRLDGSP